MVEENKGEDYLCVKDGKDHGHIPQNASWRELLGELGPHGDIPG